MDNTPSWLAGGEFSDKHAFKGSGILRNAWNTGKNFFSSGNKFKSIVPDWVRRASTTVPPVVRPSVQSAQVVRSMSGTPWTTAAQVAPRPYVPPNPANANPSGFRSYIPNWLGGTKPPAAAAPDTRNWMQRGRDGLVSGLGWALPGVALDAAIGGGGGGQQMTADQMMNTLFNDPGTGPLLQQMMMNQSYANPSAMSAMQQQLNQLLQQQQSPFQQVAGMQQQQQQLDPNRTRQLFLNIPREHLTRDPGNPLPRWNEPGASPFEPPPASASPGDIVSNPPAEYTGPPGADVPAPGASPEATPGSAPSASPTPISADTWKGNRMPNYPGKAASAPSWLKKK